jgi:hypothetical protein
MEEWDSLGETLEEGKEVKFNTFHCQGKAKHFMRQFYLRINESDHFDTFPHEHGT